MKKIILFILLMASPGWATTYYVNATGGDDGRSTAQAQNSGTPWLTIQKCLDNVAGGDTCSVAAGTYGTTSVAATLATKVAGTNSTTGKITIQGAGLATTKIYGCVRILHNYYKLNGFTIDSRPYTYHETDATVLVSNSNNTEVSDCELTNSNPDDHQEMSGLTVSGTASDITIKNNLIHNMSYTIIFFASNTNRVLFENNEVAGRTMITDSHKQDWDCLLIWGTDHIIRNNLFRDFKGSDGTYEVPHTDWVQTHADGCAPDFDDCISKGHIFEGNTVKNFSPSVQFGQATTDSSIHIYDWTFRNNVFYNISRTFNCYIPEVKFYNNTFVECGTEGQHPLSFTFLYLCDNGLCGDVTFTASTKTVSITGYAGGNLNSGHINPGVKVNFWGSSLNTRGNNTHDTWYTVVELIDDYSFTVAEDLVNETVTGNFCTISEFESAARTQVINNLFINCGGTDSDTLGWAGGESWLKTQGGNFSYNYVTKSHPTYASKSGYSESNSVNGGDPKFTNYSTQDFTLTATAPTNVGTNLSAYFTTDKAGNTRPSTGAWAIGAYEYDGEDVTPPTLSTKTIASNGTTLTLAFNETVSVGSGGNGGWTISPSGGAATLSYSSGNGTSSLVYTISRAIQSGETATVSYTQPTNGIEDSAGNDLANLSNSAVTNNSTQGTGQGSPVTLIIQSGGMIPIIQSGGMGFAQ